MNGNEALERTVELLRRLVGIDTTSHRSNLALIEFVEDYLQGHGIASHRFADAEGRKANLFASVGPAADGGLVLSGHTDVVPVDGQDWSTDPFTLCERDGRYYGRGACDMKGFIAAVLAMAPELARAELRVPVHLALSFDEENGCLGVPLMLREIGRTLPRPRIAVIGEPTGMAIVAGHKAGCECTTRVRGSPGHASVPERAVNAVAYGARLVEYLERTAAEYRAAAPADCPFEPPCTTISVGILQGGTAVNIIPDTCTLRWEVRPLPGEDMHAVVRRLAEYADRELLPSMRAIAPEADISTAVDAEYPGLEFDPDSPAVRLVRRLTGANETRVVSFGTEAGFFEQAGMSTVVCGPGSIEQAHKPDEYVSRDQLAACLRFLQHLKEWAEGVGPAQVPELRE